MHFIKINCTNYIKSCQLKIQIFNFSIKYLQFWCSATFAKGSFCTISRQKCLHLLTMK